MRITITLSKNEWNRVKDITEEMSENEYVAVDEWYSCILDESVDILYGPISAHLNHSTECSRIDINFGEKFTNVLFNVVSKLISAFNVMISCFVKHFKELDEIFKYSNPSIMVNNMPIDDYFGE